MFKFPLPTLLRVLLAGISAAPMAAPSQAQMAVIDPSNLMQNALTATRTLEQINNQIQQITNQVRSLENEARNLTSLGQRFADAVQRSVFGNELCDPRPLCRPAD